MTRQLRKEPTNFPRWLKLQVAEGAVLCRCTTDDGQRDVKLHKGGKGTQSCAFTARNVVKLGSSRVEALDKEGNLVGIFDFPVTEDDDPRDHGAYAKEDGDTGDERLLKTFARLLADAHAGSSKKLVEAVGIITQHHAEERKNMTGAMQSLERMMARMSRSRVRVQDLAEEARGDEEDDSSSEVLDALKPMITEYIRARANGAVPGEGKE